MLRGIVFISLFWSIVSCNDKKQEAGNERDGFITTRDADYLPTQSSLEVIMQGNWLEEMSDSVVWSFHKSELKWKGFSHNVSFKEDRVEVGNIVFKVKTKDPETLELINLKTKEKRILSKQAVLIGESD